MMTRARASAVLCGGAALLLNSARAGSQTPATIRMATLPIEGTALCYYAKDMGFFAKAGLDVDIQTMQNGASSEGPQRQDDRRCGVA